MTAITVRAPDSRKAMEELLRRLGPDALILSTRHVNGMVEISALPPDADPASLPPNPTPAPTPAPTPPGVSSRIDPASFAPRCRPPPAAPRQQPAPIGGTSSRSLFLPEGLAEDWPTRILIAGPPGAGKSMLAARISARLMLAEPGIRPQVIAPVPATLLTEDRLRGWCRLMGLTLERPGIAAAMALPDPSPATPQIIDLSDCPGDATALPRG